jgi:hypothetical protein
MADNYLEFSESFDDLTPEETAWLKTQLDVSPDTDCPCFPSDPIQSCPVPCCFPYSSSPSRHLYRRTAKRLGTVQPPESTADNHCVMWASTITGEEVVLFTLAESPIPRDAKKK